jgi:16S rRNA (guanine966-N2)-methyltransferase
MRIIAGRYKGRSIEALAGSTTRPTTSRVRESWASSVGGALPEGFAGAHVLDAFAGSGALGIEALSRGAASCTFCEKSHAAAQLLRRNLRALSVGPEARVCEGDVLGARLQRTCAAGPAFNLVVLDPPYRLPAATVASLLASLAQAGCLQAGCTISYEHATGAPGTLGEALAAAAPALPALDVLSCKTFGDTAIDYYCLA